jgi:N-acetylneuraminate lyase
MTPPRLTGLIAAPFTPFHADGRLNPERIADQAAFLAANGADGAFVCGTTGEGTSLMTEERLAVAESWVRAADRLPVIVNVAHTSAREACRLAEHAGRVGAAAVASTAPYYFRPAGVRELVAFLADVAAAAGVPFYYYDIPSTTGVLLPTAEVLRRGAEVIPNLVGVKYSNPDLLTLQECVALEGGRFNVLFGIDEYLLAGLALGADGAVGSTYNFAAPLYRRMRERLAAGDPAGARALQQRAAKMVRVLIDFGGVRAGKVMMGLVGVDCGPVRPPLRPVGPDERRALFDRLTAEVPDVFARPLALDPHFVGE